MVCGPKVTNAAEAYYVCLNAGPNAYFYSPNITNVDSCFAGHGSGSGLLPLYLYVPENSITLNTCLNPTSNLFGAVFSGGSRLNLNWVKSLSSGAVYYYE